MKSLKQFVEEADEAAIKIFADRGEMLPMYHVIAGDDRHGIFAPPSTNKDESVAIVRAALANMMAKRVLFITEAWTAHEDKGSRAVQDFAANNSLEHWEDRKEAIVYMAEDADEGQLLASREIIREPNQPPRLGPLKCQPPVGTHEGRMIGLLPTQGRSH